MDTSKQLNAAERYALFMKVVNRMNAQNRKRQSDRRRQQRLMDEYDDNTVSSLDNRDDLYWGDEQSYISTHYSDSISVNRNRGNFDDEY